MSGLLLIAGGGGEGKGGGGQRRWRCHWPFPHVKVAKEGAAIIILLKAFHVVVIFVYIIRPPPLQTALQQGRGEQSDAHTGHGVLRE
jgi:hypothetical protein